MFLLSALRAAAHVTEGLRKVKKEINLCALCGSAVIINLPLTTDNIHPATDNPHPTKGHNKGGDPGKRLF